MKINLKKYLIVPLFLIAFPLNIFAADISNIEKYQESLYTQKEITELPEAKPQSQEQAFNDTSQETNLSGKDLKIHNIVKNSNVYDIYNPIPTTSNTTVDASNFTSKNSQTLFQNGDIYRISRISFKNDKKERYELNIPIRGNSIMIRYVDPTTKQWVATSNIANLKCATLFIDTDTHSYVISVPAVYKNTFPNSTLTIVRNEELTPKLTKKDGLYELKISFPQNKNLIGEYWTLESDEPLVNWNLNMLNELKRNDLAIERRWSYDGYYFQTPSSYVPSGTDVLYKHAANYTGAYFIKNPINNLFKEMGYVMTKTCMENQNSQGYWATGPKSTWLETDFGIGANFYDTRFSTDFAVSLLHGYQLYNDKDFLKSAVEYAEFFVEYAKNNSYKIEQGGILVQDYDGVTDPTHVSLNHHLAELNFLYELYYITNEKSYLDLANEMLLGVENTMYRWVLPDNNLNYCLFYTKDTNTMVDYPYLTYNDLYHTNYLLNLLFNKSSDAITYLMNCKKQWMDNNNVTGYLK
ncbi:MAG: hypothetical protein K2L15_01440 [Eubacteriales bacterium]|nr:hypothetical protein [Eubacteriales bacterium]